MCENMGLSSALYATLLVVLFIVAVFQMLVYFKADCEQHKNHIIEHILLIALGAFALTYLYVYGNFEVLGLWAMMLIWHRIKERRYLSIVKAKKC